MNASLIQNSIHCSIRTYLLVYYFLLHQRAEVQYSRSICTMLQKLSKYEVKAWLCRNLMIFLPLRFYVKSNFGEFFQSKNVIFGKFRDSELWILVNLGLECCSNLLKSKFRTSTIVKINIFGSFEFTKIWFHVKL